VDESRFANSGIPSKACRTGGHRDHGGVCAVCGEWLPAARCRAPGCRWSLAAGEQTLAEAVRHQHEARHRVRVVIG
jgi:hypothetical protein